MKYIKRTAVSFSFVITLGAILIMLSGCTVMTYYKHDPTEKIADRADVNHHQYDSYRVNGVIVFPHFVGISEHPNAGDTLVFHAASNNGKESIRIKEVRLNGLIINLAKNVVSLKKSKTRSHFSASMILKYRVERNELVEGVMNGSPVVVLDVEVTSNGKTERRKLTYIFHKVVKVYPPSV